MPFHLDPSNRLATVHERYRQDRTDRTDRQTDRQRSDSIGRTVLQTVAQKSDKTRPNLWLIQHVLSDVAYLTLYRSGRDHTWQVYEWSGMTRHPGRTFGTFPSTTE